MSADHAERPGDGANAPRSARVHDLGYQRYEGTRRPQSTRFRTIIRNVVSSSWRGFWRMKAWAITAVLTLFAVGAVMYVSEHLSGFDPGGQRLALLPMSFSFFGLSALLLSFTVVGGLIADDLRTGAFEFYFSRPIRTRDYVLGKLGGALVIMACMLMVGPILLALFHVGLTGAGNLSASLELVPRAALVGAVATAAYASVPLAFSAMSSRRRHTLAAWAAFYFIIGGLAQLTARYTEIPALAVLDLSTAVTSLAYQMFDMPAPMGQDVPAGWYGLVALLGYTAVAIVFLYRRVAAAERAGMGGG